MFDQFLDFNGKILKILTYNSLLISTIP